MIRCTCGNASSSSNSAGSSSGAVRPTGAVDGSTPATVSAGRSSPPGGRASSRRSPPAASTKVSSSRRVLVEAISRSCPAVRRAACSTASSSVTRARSLRSSRSTSARAASTRSSAVVASVVRSSRSACRPVIRWRASFSLRRSVTFSAFSSDTCSRRRSRTCRVSVRAWSSWSCSRLDDVLVDSGLLRLAPGRPRPPAAPSRPGGAGTRARPPQSAPRPVLRARRRRRHPVRSAPGAPRRRPACGSGRRSRGSGRAPRRTASRACPERNWRTAAAGLGYRSRATAPVPGRRAAEPVAARVLARWWQRSSRRCLPQSPVRSLVGTAPWHSQ